MMRKPDRDGPQAAGRDPKDTAANTTAGRDPAKKFRVFGIDETSGKKVTILVTGRDPATGETVTGIDEVTGKQVKFKVAGRDPA